MQSDSSASLSLVLEVVGATVADWDLDLGEELGPETRLSADLCFSSVEVMHLLATIDLRLGRKLPYDRLIKQGLADYLLPTIVHSASEETAIAKKSWASAAVAALVSAKPRMPLATASRK